MDEKKNPAEAKGRRKNAENPLFQPDSQKTQKTNGYKLRILVIILVLLIIALIAAFVSEIGIYGKQGYRADQAGALAVETVKI